MIHYQSRWLAALLAGLFAIHAGVAVDRLTAAEPIKPSPGPSPIVPPPPPLEQLPKVPAQEKDAEEERPTTIPGANFIVECNRPRSARLVAEMAELHRKQVAERWLGKELPNWTRPCRIRVEITQDGNLGATSMSFPDGKIGDLSMQVRGTLERILTDALPRQVTHTVIATHFGRPVPRWADGIATMSESPENIQRQSRLVPGLLAEERTKKFKDLFAQKDYPSDLISFFAQSHSVVKFLVDFKGRTKLLAFIDEGYAGDWDKSAQMHYGCNLDELELAWKNHASGKAPLPMGATPDKLPASKITPTPTTAIAVNEQQQTEIAWARELAKDFLNAAESAQQLEALGLLSPEYASAVGRTEERDKRPYYFLPLFYDRPKILSETVSPNGLEIVFIGSLRVNREADPSLPDKEFRLRVTSHDKKWRVSAFITQDKQSAKK